VRGRRGNEHAPHHAGDEGLDSVAAYEGERDRDRSNRLTDVSTKRAIIVRSRFARMLWRGMLRSILAVRRMVMAAITAGGVAPRRRSAGLVRMPMRMPHGADDRIDAEQRDRQQRDKSAEAWHVENPERPTTGVIVT
jgi:hypothetical protein